MSFGILRFRLRLRLRPGVRGFLHVVCPFFRIVFRLVYSIDKKHLSLILLHLEKLDAKWYVSIKFFSHIVKKPSRLFVRDEKI